MSQMQDVKAFLNRMEGEIDRIAPLKLRETTYGCSYRQNSAHPGPDYVYVGECLNSEHKVLGTEFDAKRTNCLRRLFSMKRERPFILLEEAVQFDGFFEILGRFERELLVRTAPGTVIGPAYDPNGTPMPNAFAVWVPVSKLMEISYAGQPGSRSAEKQPVF